MLLQTTKRSPCGHIVARVTLDTQWTEYLVCTYHRGAQVSAVYAPTRADAELLAEVAVRETLAPAAPTLSLVPLV